MIIITKRKQKEIDKLNIKKIMFALQFGKPQQKIENIKLHAENIYAADNVII